MSDVTRIPITGFAEGVLTAVVIWGAVSIIFNIAAWGWVIWKAVRK